MKIQKTLIVSLCAIATLLIVSCSHDEHGHYGVVEKFQEEGKKYEPVKISSERYNEHIKKIEVTEKGHTFLIPERKSQIKSFNCTECHSEPLAELQEEGFKKAHWNIKLDHAEESTMNCLTCHNGEGNMDNLHTLSGNIVDFNNSYNLCKQCHQKQYSDWTGGAHGKKIGGWAPPRTSLSCVNCHNPHKPHFDKRWPARYNSQKIQERK